MSTDAVWGRVVGWEGGEQGRRARVALCTDFGMTAQPAQDHDRRLSPRSCDDRDIGEDRSETGGNWCFRWRRKSVYAVIAHDGVGVGHVLARWQHWHNVIYDDVTSIGPVGAA